MSPGVWNGGKQIAVPEERIGSLVETQEIKHPVRARVFAKVWGKSPSSLARGERKCRLRQLICTTVVHWLNYFESLGGWCVSYHSFFLFNNHKSSILEIIKQMLIVLITPYKFLCSKRLYLYLPIFFHSSVLSQHSYLEPCHSRAGHDTVFWHDTKYFGPCQHDTNTRAVLGLARHKNGM